MKGNPEPGESPGPVIHLLLVEDDRRLAALTREYLERHGVEVTHVTDGESGLKEARRDHFDLVLLDIMLPGRSGIEVCRKLRERSDTPVIMITARDEEADRVLGLEIGADDYLPKPFSPRELLARIRAVLRRTRGGAGPAGHVVKAGDLVLDPGSHRAVLRGIPLDLTSYEFSLLLALAERPGRVLSRDQLMDLVKGTAEESFDRSVDVHISRLRRKLDDDPHRPVRIRTVRGRGYQFIGRDEP